MLQEIKKITRSLKAITNLKSQGTEIESIQMQ